jgi:hypothetical protein
MGSCACNSTSTNEQILNSFWASLPIRQKFPSEYKKIVIDAFAKTKNFNERAKDVENVCLTSSDHKEISTALWSDIVSKSKNKQYFFLSLFFLCQSNKNDAKAIFREIVQLSNANKVIVKDEQTKKEFIHLEEMIDILTFYISYVSEACIPHVKNLVNSEKQDDFITFMKEVFLYSRITSLIKNHFQKNYPGKDSINYDEFWDKSYPYFGDDDKIRDDLFTNYKNDPRVKNETPVRTATGNLAGSLSDKTPK